MLSIEQRHQMKAALASGDIHGAQVRWLGLNDSMAKFIGQPNVLSTAHRNMAPRWSSDDLLRLPARVVSGGNIDPLLRYPLPDKYAHPRREQAWARPPCALLPARAIGEAGQAGVLAPSPRLCAEHALRSGAAHPGGVRPSSSSVSEKASVATPLYDTAGLRTSSSFFEESLLSKRSKQQLASNPLNSQRGKGPSLSASWTEGARDSRRSASPTRGSPKRAGSPKSAGGSPTRSSSELLPGRHAHGEESKLQSSLLMPSRRAIATGMARPVALRKFDAVQVEVQLYELIELQGCSTRGLTGPWRKRQTRRSGCCASNNAGSRKRGVILRPTPHAAAPIKNLRPRRRAGGKHSPRGSLRSARRRRARSNRSGRD
mmetsp:Transcript_5316/g.12686  ORF Transcript_5316/g.12686 Transcript_5316/m.12686 type:complete len:373 (-) Transcript_5316:686-1804(-)